MGYNLVIREEALIDIYEGYDWYEDKKVGLGERFTNEVDSIIAYIHRYPLHYQIKYNDIREGVLKIFPFIISYKVIENDVVVYSVFPTSDNPDRKPS